MKRRFSALINIILIIVMLTGTAAYASTPDDYNFEDPSLLTADQLYCESGILIDADSGRTLFSKNERVRLHPASTTKIMTLLLGIESGFPLDQQIAIPQAAADIAKDSTLVPVFPGETMTFGDLLTGFMLNSGNDGANAVAVLVAGSIDNFVTMMNRRAAEIGCRDTHFTNPHGYTEQDHYTTAYDLALITKVAMENETFRNIVALPSAQIVVNERGPIQVGKKHLMLVEDSGFYYEGCIGVKTGTTDAAGKCYVGAAEKDGATVISVIMKAPEENHRWVDTSRLFDYGWTCYDAYTLDQMYEVASPQIASFVISNASEDDPFAGKLDLEIAQISNNDYLRMIERENPTALSVAVEDFISRTKREITHDLTAPISQGEIVGNFSYFDPSTGNTITAKLIASRDVEKRVEHMALTDFFPFLKIFENKLFLMLLAVLGILIILIIMLAESRKAARQRRRRKIYEQRRAEYMRSQRAQHERERSRSPSRRRYSDFRDPWRPR